MKPEERRSEGEHQPGEPTRPQAKANGKNGSAGGKKARSRKAGGKKPDGRKPKKRKRRRRDLLAYEQAFWCRGCCVAGVDEAGRGPLAGPVVAAAVILPQGACVDGADDSKVLTPDVRAELYDCIMATARCVGVGAASVREIDHRNILRATTIAMQRALDRLAEPPDHVVVDGLPVKHLGREHEAVVDGDAIVHSIACASIVAKVVRDRLMKRLARRYPGYFWETNVGYSTPEHRAAIRELGVTPHHRLTFAGLQYELEI